jgi:hypothetical protein
MVPAGLYNLCDPAFYYLLISFTIIIVIALQNFGQGFNYCVGVQSCPSNNVIGFFIVKIVYIFVWTWLLNLLCKNGYEPISWILVLIPIVLMFVFMALYVLNQYDYSRLFTLPNLFN